MTAELDIMYLENKNGTRFLFFRFSLSSGPFPKIMPLTITQNNGTVSHFSHAEN